MFWHKMAAVSYPGECTHWGV
uniref:Uncharacterized protein n=1 Tax=Anguilla anguilla TaxID=7936 RepID=A0A0E9UJ48_ANGAN